MSHNKHRHVPNHTAGINLKSAVNYDEGGIKINFEEITPAYGSNDVLGDPFSTTPRMNYSFFDNETVPAYSNFTSDDYCSSNNSHVYLNVTCEFPINYAEPMYG